MNRAIAALKRALRPSRIARSISAILVLTFIQTIALPIIDVGISKASASTLYDNRSNFLQWDTWRSAANHVPYWNESTSEITSNSSAVQFTQNVNSQTGFAWNTQTVSISRDFIMSANYYFGQVDGADGIVFFMRPLSTWPNGGTAGASTGSWSHWSSNEVRVYFDTYANGSEIAQDHIRISALKDWAETAYSGNGIRFKNGAGTTIDDVETNQSFPLTIKWTASSRTIEVFSGLNANYLITSAVIPTTDLSLTEYNWGWMGFTGGANNYQYVTDVNYQVGPNVSTTSSDTTVVDGTSVTLNASYQSSESSPTTRWEYSTDGGSTWTTTGVSTTSYTFTATRSLTQRKYRYYVESTAVGTTFSRATNPITLRVTAPILRSETDTALTTSGTKYATLSNSSPLIPGTVSTMTIEAWVRPSTTCDGAVACSIISVNNSYLIQVLNGKIRYYIGSGSAWCDGGAGKVPADAFVPGDRWSHITFVRVNANVKIYINGQLRSNLDSSCSPTTQAANSNAFFIGVKSANTEAFSGSIDEVKIWSTDRSANTASDMHSNETSTSGLLNYWNFNEGTGTIAYNDVASALATTDLTITDASTWDANVVSEAVIGPAYTTRTFYRSFITENGGWKIPSSVSTASVLVIAGGGGGGSRVGGGGGAGGFAFIPKVSLTPNSIELIQVGQGGFGAQRPLVDEWRGQNGQSSFFGTKIRTVGGGGGGGYDTAANNAEHDGKAGGSGGGASAYSTSGGSGTPGPSTQVSTYGYGSGNSGGSGSGQSDYPAGGGGGAGSAGFSAANNFTSAAGGAGIVDPIGGTNLCYAAGGGGGIGLGASGAGGAAGSCGAGTTTTASAGTKGRVVPADATPNSGSGGGGAGYQTGSTADVAGGAGGSGVIVIRWITALKPTYAKPVNAYLNVGMTETFTTNVAQDSATAGLTRTFKWESTTPTANGAYTLIKQGTGAANAAFSWIPSDTTTSGSGYLYRLTVTDSDTAGLFITDSSTAYAVINRALNVSGQATIPKAINISKSETFTITLGTSTYRTTMTSNNPGITLDTSTATSPVIRISETMTVGTYYETLTVIDSVSASVVIPLTIKVQAPPSLTASGEIVKSDLVIDLDFSNSASYNPLTGQISDISGSKRTVASNGSPTYSSDYSGVMSFKANSSQYLKYTNQTQLKRFTIDVIFRLDDYPAGERYLVANQYSNPNYNFALVLDAARTLWTGFYAGAYNGYRTGTVLDVGKWYHVTSVWTGTQMLLYINGSLDTSGTAFTLGTVTDAPVGGSEVYINRDRSLNVFTDVSFGNIRIYKRNLTDLEVLQNYNANKSRFDLSNLNQLKLTQKYGTVTLDSFTATSGGDTKTITFSSSLSGITWDTLTVANRANLAIGNSLSVGTYYDTLTVTDNLGQSTFLPLSMTVTKADTITVSMGTSLTTVYNGSAPAVAPKASITGLVGVDTATVATGYYSLSCAQGGICKVGDVGPGGGTVFYVSKSPINAADGVSAGGLYLEIAPKNWNGNGSGEAPSSFATNLTSVPGTSTNIGTGAENSRLWRAALGDSATAVTLALNKTSGGVDDWFVPSYGELTTAITTLQPLGKGSFESYANLWSSTQNAADANRTNNAWSSNPPVLNTLLKTDNYYLRPIRAFSPTVGETSTPIDVETYTAIGTNLSFQIGATSNYQAVVYETSTLKITQANQNKLIINLYGAVAGLPFTIQVTGGSGTGAITETITAGSTATNCQVVNHVLSNSNAAGDQKTCNIRVTKAASRNYLEESTTATVYFMAFVDNQPRNQVGSGSTIGLNGINQIWAEPGTAPTISTFTASGARGSTITINGSGFNTPILIVEFNFYQVASTVTVVSPTQLTVVVPSGATTGPIVVTNSYSSAFSATDFTVG